MELKKSKKADLERNKGIFIQIGLVVALAIMFLAFEWKSHPKVDNSNMPKFNGGDPTVEFRKYISDNMKYPQIAIENGISGKVIVQFVVNTQGKVTDAVIAGSVDPALDKEALRVILSSPSWTPGKQRGKAVKVAFYFPINFILNY